MVKIKWIFVKICLTQSVTLIFYVFELVLLAKCLGLFLKIKKLKIKGIDINSEI